ncbi:pyridoxamine 5'-phosphate oxidase family protein [Glaciihabitans sp. dw_435]|uniref:pyridoxamine 5'-phosphate oxidase family protein n=1 Tax=Glaciihabitans sp. dw_435 TaxID=2720081 RepID=UPI001BD42652|nr:pyridoxamine 5'-phosphate oxidase family protein [Glaciihabitans sp. dw_435]
MLDDEVTAELRNEGALSLLETAPMSRLAYNGSDGFPRVIPIGFFWNGDAIVVCTAVTSPKVRALVERPEVAVTIDVGNTPSDARALLLRGTASLERVDGIPREYIAASAKVLSEAELYVFERAVAGTYEQMVRITIVPSWARYFDFGAGRLPAFLQDLVNKA